MVAMSEQGRLRAVEAVNRRLTRMQVEPTNLARKIGISDTTLRHFLDGKTWPIMRTMGRIEDALGWPAGSIEDIARGGPIPGDTPAPEAHRDPEVTSVRTADSLPKGSDTSSIVLLFEHDALAGLKPFERDQAETRARLAVLEYVEQVNSRAAGAGANGSDQQSAEEPSS